MVHFFRMVWKVNLKGEIVQFIETDGKSGLERESLLIMALFYRGAILLCNLRSKETITE